MADTRPSATASAAADTAAAATYTTFGAHPALADYLRRIHPEEGMLLGGRMIAASDGGTFDVVDPALMDYIDKHNSTMYAPRVVVGAYDDAVCLQADMVAFTGEGMSDAQLRGFLDSALTTLLSFYETAAEDLSDLVTRTEGD